MRKLFVSRISKMILVLAAMLVGPGLFAAKADTIFTFNGTFQGGATLSGTLTINTATGAVDGINLMVGGATFTFVQAQGQGTGTEYLLQLTTTSAFNFPILDVYFPVSTLIGYAGGDLCIAPDFVPTNCANPTQTGSGSTAYLTEGSDTAAVPEPSSFLLLTGGLIGLGLLGRKMHFANGKA
ncbi:MAG TPA: PEP-CTERM sorting domain-containing protein [Candidatus Acidoferrales bacterium]